MIRIQKAPNYLPKQSIGTLKHTLKYFGKIHKSCLQKVTN